MTPTNFDEIEALFADQARNERVSNVMTITLRELRARDGDDAFYLIQLAAGLVALAARATGESSANVTHAVGVVATIYGKTAASIRGRT